MHSAVKTYVQEYQPASVLECTAEPWLELEQFCREFAVDFVSLPPTAIPQQVSHSVDLAIVHDGLERLTLSAGQQLLGGLRNSLAKRVWLLLPRRSEWTLPSLVALGFKMDQPALLGEDTLSYTYDIDSYNHKREWNNSRFWANPENFNKYRW